MSEKRREIRTLKKILVCFKGEGFAVYSNTKDVSDHGAFISTQYLLTEGAEIEVKLDDIEVEKKAKVVWVSYEAKPTEVDNIGFGVQFLF